MVLSKEDKTELLTIFRKGQSHAGPIKFSIREVASVSMDHTICLYDFADAILEEG